MAFDVSAKTSTVEPIAFRRSRWARSAVISSSAERVRSCAEYQPDTQARPNGASAALRAAASRGNLWPSSMPSKPASLASARHVSSGVSPPSSRRSSFDQPMGFAPIRIIRAFSSVSCFVGGRRRSPPPRELVDALQGQRLFVLAPRRLDFVPRRNLRYGHVPPMPARIGRCEGIGVDDDDAGAVGGSRLAQGPLEVGDVVDL